MLTRPEMVNLLTAASAYDNRQPNPAAVMAWGKASEIGRWTFDEALEALHAHYAETTDFVMPGHITARIRVERQDRAMRAEARQLEETPTNPAAAERIQQIITEVAEQMGWTEPGTPRTGFALKVRCPHCGAAEGKRCFNPANEKPLTKTTCHESRALALADFMRTTS